MLELNASDEYNNQEFYLQLKDISTKTIISENIGYMNKGGNLLNLGEAHQIICSKSHGITYLHDLTTDVKLTKCIFDKLLRVMTRKGLNMYEFF
jgi:hypothetical protein